MNLHRLAILTLLLALLCAFLAGMVAQTYRQMVTANFNYLLIPHK